MPPSPPIPVAVIGCGRMGRLHARTYAQMPTVKLVGVFDTSPPAAAAAAAEYNTHPFSSLADLLPLVRAVTIATPTHSHLAVAEPFLSRGVACLIEKPLARDEAEGQQIVDLAAKHNAPVQVGHIERFNPAVRALSRLNLKPRFIETVRVSPLPFRSLDVGVVLDVMVHDIDIVLHLAASAVSRVEAVGVSVLGGNAEDVCNARLTFASGCVANLTASRLALKTERRLRVFTPDAYVSVDYQKKQGVVVRRGENLERLREAANRVRSGELRDPSQLNYADLIKLESLPIDDADPIRAQLDAFIAAISRGERPLVSAEDGLAAVRVARQIVEAMPPTNLS